MIYRPWPIVVIALFHIIAPVLNFAVSASLLDMSYYEYFQHQAHYGIHVIAIWIIPFLAGVSLLTFRMWSYYLFLIFMMFACLFTLYQRLLYPHRIDIFLFLFLELINFIVIIYFLSPPVKHIYVNKRIRWWQHSPRYLIDHKATALIQFENKNLPHLNLEIRFQNISEGGAYIVAETPLNNKDIIRLQFYLFNKNYEVKSQVVHAQSNGYGVLFSESLASRKDMRQLMKTLKKNKVPVRGHQLSAIESFKFWFSDLLKTGHGLFPK